MSTLNPARKALEAQESLNLHSIPGVLKWAGGKQKQVSYLIQFLPVSITDNTIYREPFFGAGSMFFALRPKNAYLSDANPCLINFFKELKRNPDSINASFRRLLRMTSSAHYYDTRDSFNRGSNAHLQAARFLYLNRLSYNGIYRVNRKGEYNVPYGRKKLRSTPSAADIRDAANALAKATLSIGSFEKCLFEAGAGDFIYLDPPYPPITTTSFFHHYTQDRFDNDDQERLATLVKKLSRLGCKIMMTNADTVNIRRLYKDFYISDKEVVRFVSCKRKKRRASELIITNYGKFLDVK